MLGRIDSVLDGLCPCGAQPRDVSPYCSYDCEPNYRAVHTSSDTDGTQMRWRPDLVSAAFESDMELIHEFRRGRFNAQAFVYSHDAQPAGHLRLDDGHRFVGVDVDDQALSGNLDETWQRLERELTNSRHAERDLSVDPWADLLAGYRALAASVIPRIDAMVLGYVPVQAVTSNHAGEAAADRFTRIAGEGWGTPEGSSLTVQFDNRHGRFIPLSSAAEALRRALARVGEAVHLAARESALTQAEHPMLQVIEQRRNRNTGPEQHRRAPRQINPRRAR